MSPTETRQLVRAVNAAGWTIASAEREATIDAAWRAIAQRHRGENRTDSDDLSTEAACYGPFYP